MDNTLEVVELYLVLLYVLLYIRVHQCTAVQQPSVDHHKRWDERNMLYKTTAVLQNHQKKITGFRCAIRIFG